MNEKVIPDGVYCYDSNKQCPYFTYLRFLDKKGEILIPYCALLKNGSIGGSVSDDEFDRLCILLECTDDELIDNEELFGLDLLWDQVKSCGINNN